MKLAMALGILAMSVALPARAASGTMSGKVVYLAADNATTGSTVYFINVGTAMGLCTGSIPGPTSDRALRIPDNANGDKMRAIILAAVLAGKSISGFWDDSSRDANNRCYLKNVTIS